MIRGVFLVASGFLTCLGAVILTVCVFSASYRIINDTESGGLHVFGLIRYCYYPGPGSTRSDDSNRERCFLRTAPPYDNNGRQMDPQYNRHYKPYELTTLILIVVAIGLAVLSFCFMICTLCTKFGAFAQTVTLLGSVVSCIAGFLIYTYCNEMIPNQTETFETKIFLYHYSWAYYCTMSSVVILIAAFVCSLLGSALVVVHAKDKRTAKIESIQL